MVLIMKQYTHKEMLAITYNEKTQHLFKYGVETKQLIYVFTCYSMYLLDIDIEKPTVEFLHSSYWQAIMPDLTEEQVDEIQKFRLLLLAHTCANLKEYSNFNVLMTEEYNNSPEHSLGQEVMLIMQPNAISFATYHPVLGNFINILNGKTLFLSEDDEKIAKDKPLSIFIVENENSINVKIRSILHKQTIPKLSPYIPEFMDVLMKHLNFIASVQIAIKMPE